MTGESNPMWKAERAEEDRAGGHSTAGHQAWREKVLEKDGNKCVCCGSDGPLHAHHILPYAIYEELREDVDNGVTLCVDCHNRFHAGYGKDVTDVDLNRFLERCS